MLIVQYLNHFLTSTRICQMLANHAGNLSCDTGVVNLEAVLAGTMPVMFSIAMRFKKIYANVVKCEA
jgi:hypothetical protein